MSDNLKAMKERNRENQKVVLVNVGVLRSAMREIKSLSAVSGKGIMTDAILNALRLNIERVSKCD